MRLQLLVISALLLMVAGAASAQEDVPFRTRNLSPFVSIFGIPAWHVPRDTLEVSVTTELANHYRLSGRGPDRLILDGETLRTTAFVSRRLNERWAVSIEVPYYRVYGGVLDDVIDGWHSTFSLPDGGRNNRPEGLVEFEMSRNGKVFYNLGERASGFGDVQLGANLLIGSVGVAALALKLPTGDDAMFAGSGSADWALSFLRPRAVRLRNRAAGYFWGFGVVKVGAGPAADYGQRDSGYFGTFGGSLAITPRVGVRVQVDAHSAFYRSQLEEIGERGFQGSIGGWWEFGARGLLDFAFNEDLEVSTSPDIVLHFSAKWRW